MATYSQIIGIPPNASVSTLKKAYRKKARELHPDLNPSPDANEQFIRLNEAYEYLLNQKTGKVFQEQEQEYTRPQSPVKTYAQWKEEEREKARERARRHARMKYEEFKKTSYYQNELALENLGDNLMFFTLLLATICFLLFGVLGGQFIAIIVGSIMALAGIPVWRGALKPENDIGLGHLFRSVWKLIKTHIFGLLMLGAVNLFILFKVVTNTLAPLEISLVILFLLMTAGRVFVSNSSRVKNNAYNRSLYTYVIFPGVFNLFFLINFLGSHSPSKEVYHYRSYQTKTYSRYSERTNHDNTPLIILDDNAYADYPGIRILFRPGQIQYNNHIEYHFREGLFGLRVVYSYGLFMAMPARDN